ncbi:MAG: hypothetical protein AAF769_14770 [Pseudomonadota bacterium]
MSDKQQSRFNLATSLVAIAISIVAMLVSLVEVSAMRTQQRAEVWPYIDLATGYNSEGFYLKLENKGVGPALMHDVLLLRGGEPVTDLDAFVLDVVGPEDAFSYDTYRTNNPSDSVIAPGEVSTLFGVPWEPRTRKFVENMGTDLDITACYCSIHEDCWRATLSAPRPEPVQRCD